MKFSRAEFPVCAEFILAMRSEFGADQVHVQSVHENGVHIGPPLPPANGAANVEESE